MLVVFVVMAMVFSPSYGLYENCDYLQNMAPGVQYPIFNPNYPGKYGPSRTCRWQARAPENYYILLSCSTNMPNSVYCAQDSLTVSISGDPNLRDGKNVCGTQKFSVNSWDNLISLAFASASNTQGGTFSCTIQAVQTSCNCGWQKTVRIVGGTETQPNEFPMMAAMTDVSNSNKPNIVCGATIISKRFCLTAAHCTLNRSPSNTVMVLGEHDIRTGTDTGATQVRFIEYFKRHEQFSTTTMQYDIALVKMTQDVIYSGLVGPACLPFKYQSSDLTGLNAVVLGWGTTDFGGSTSPVLKKTTLTVQSFATCNANYPNRIIASQFCTYAPGTDACQNDSGGPLLWLDPSSSRINTMGAISYGKIGCATKTPGVNTNIGAFVGWITSNTEGTAFCQK